LVFPGTTKSWCGASSLGEKAFSADPTTIAAAKKLAVADT
jgi:hypothetical protein